MQYPDYKPTLESPPLSDDELQALDGLLVTGGAFDVDPALWGGGALCLAGWVATWGGAPASLADLFRFDRPMGWWFPNWGRNLILSTEAVYHVLVALAWLGALQRRWGLALGAVVVVAATHPFTGLHQLLIFGAWCGILALRERSRAAWGRLALVAVVAAGFAGYYFVFLESFAAHRLLQAGWSRGWRLPGLTILLAAGPAAAVAAWRLHRQQWRIDERRLLAVRLLLIALPEAEIETLMDEARGGNHVFSVDLEAQTVVSPSGAAFIRASSR